MKKKDKQADCGKYIKINLYVFLRLSRKKQSTSSASWQRVRTTFYNYCSFLQRLWDTDNQL